MTKSTRKQAAKGRRIVQEIDIDENLVYLLGSLPAHINIDKFRHAVRQLAANDRIWELLKQGHQVNETRRSIEQLIEKEVSKIRMK